MYDSNYHTRCWACHSEISSETCLKCDACGWYICITCGACSAKSCTGSARKGEGRATAAFDEPAVTFGSIRPRRVWEVEKTLPSILNENLSLKEEQPPAVILDDEMLWQILQLPQVEVFHSRGLGKGTVVRAENRPTGRRVCVAFEETGETKEFVFPDAFSKSEILSLVNSEKAFADLL